MWAKMVRPGPAGAGWDSVANFRVSFNITGLSEQNSGGGEFSPVKSAWIKHGLIPVPIPKFRGSTPNRLTNYSHMVRHSDEVNGYMDDIPYNL